jgi:hypothetical protein
MMNWLKKMFGWFEKLINEHGSAKILEARLVQKDDEISALRMKNQDLQLTLEKEQIQHQKTRDELQRLRNEHSEEIRIYKEIEFRRSKRTDGKWAAFCPKCHLPVSGRGVVQCKDQKRCGWFVLIGKLSTDDLIKELGS